MGGRFAGLAVAAAMMAGPALAQTGSLFTDPQHDAAHPARMEVVHIPTHGVRINGVFYLASGAGPHPTMVFFHGMPGNEQNLDLAQAVRRAGWNVLTLHYRGSWGSPGTYSYPHLIEDGVAALAFVRSPANVAAYGVDPGRIVLAGHSSGGFVAVNTAVRSAPVQGLLLISGTDDAGEAQAAKASPAAWRKFVKEGFDGLETLVGCTPAGLANQLLTGSRRKARPWRRRSASSAVPSRRPSISRRITPTATGGSPWRKRSPTGLR
jgi:pimeloyl-ACP methyl ester carboxylesterase